MNKKIGMLALAALVLGAGGSIALQSFAQTPAPAARSMISASTDQSVDQKDQKGNDLETNDDEKVVGTPSITEVQAQTVAKAQYNGTGVLKNTELEMENGTLVYATEFRESDGNEVDVKVDAKTGAIVVVSSDKTESPQDE